MKTKSIIITLLGVFVIALLLVGIQSYSKGPGVFPSWLPKPVAFKYWKNADPSSLSMPPMLGSVKDADTGFKVWRLGGSPQEMHTQTPYPAGPNEISDTHSQHFYSRTSPVNSDETHVLGAVGKYRPYAALWRLRDKRLVAWAPSAKKERHLQQRQLLWDRLVPNAYWYTEDNKLVRAAINFQNYKVTTQVWDKFDNFEYITFGFGEGNFSDDGKRIVIAGKLKNVDRIAFQPYEVTGRVKHPFLPISHVKGNIDWASVDPTGKYIVYAQAKPEQTRVLPFLEANKSPSRLLYDDIKHSDLIVDKSGEPWQVYGDWRGLFAVRLKDSFNHRVWPVESAIRKLRCESRSPDCISASGHVARVADLPGTVLVSRMKDGGLYFMNIDAPGQSLYVGNSRHGKGPDEARNKVESEPWGVSKNGEVTSYLREARGAVSRSGRYVFFTSDYRIHGTHKGSYLPEPPHRAYLNMIELGSKPPMIGAWFGKGFMHSLETPAHILVMAGLGMLLGQQGSKTLRFGGLTLAGALLVGFFLTRIFSWNSYYQLVLLGFALLTGFILILRAQLPIWLPLIIAAASGVLLGLDLLIPGMSKTYLGSLIGWLSGKAVAVWGIVLASAFIAFMVRLRWQGMVLRVLGSWLATSAIMVLALSFAS